MRYFNVLRDNGLQMAMPSVCLIREHGANEIATVGSVRSVADAVDGAVSHERSQLPRMQTHGPERESLEAEVTA